MNIPEHFHQSWRVNRDSQQIGDISSGDIPIAQVQMQEPLGHKRHGNQLREMLSDQIVAEHNALVGLNPAGIEQAIKSLKAMASNHHTAANCKMMAQIALDGLKP